MTLDGIEAASFAGPGLLHEKCDREWFLMSVYTKLLPLIRRTPGAIVVCDNAAIHHTQAFIDLVEKNADDSPTGAMVLFLPPFSPELNPIGEVQSFFTGAVTFFECHEPVDLFSVSGCTTENAFHEVKAFLERHRDFACTNPLYAFKASLMIIKNRHAGAYMHGCGYDVKNHLGFWM